MNVEVRVRTSFVGASVLSDGGQCSLRVCIKCGRALLGRDVALSGSVGGCRIARDNVWSVQVWLRRSRQSTRRRWFFERVTSSDAENGRSFTDEEGEHSVENFMLCSFAQHACSPLLQGFLHEAELCKVALTCHFSLDVLYLCQEWVELFLEFSDLWSVCSLLQLFRSALPSRKGCNSTERVVMGDSTGIVVLQTS